MMNTEIHNGSEDLKQGLLPALVVGNGPVAHMVCSSLRSMAVDVTLIYRREPSSFIHSPMMDFPPSQFTRSGRSQPGSFKGHKFSEVASLKRKGPVFTLALNSGPQADYGCVILAPDLPVKRPNSSLPVEVEALSAEKPGAAMGRLAFILDHKDLSSTGAGMAAIIRAIENVRAGGESAVFMKHIPVSHLFGETQYDIARSSGVKFYRFDGSPPEVKSLGEGKGFEIRFSDLISGDHDQTLSFDRVLAATGPDPDEIFHIWRDLIEGDQDKDGFLLDESPHCHSGRAFTNGVFAVGAITGVSDLVTAAAQGESAAIRARAWLLKLASGEVREKVRIEDTCCRCLTCVRICPHSAISFTAGPARSIIMVAPLICEECGACVSECPQNALDLFSMPYAGLRSFMDDINNVSERIVVYGCQRSAGRAFKELGPLEGVVFQAVECAGLVSEALIMDSLASGAKGVLILGCHSGNCKSKHGTDWAGARVANSLGILNPSGDHKGPQIAYRTLASNEKARLPHIINEFRASLE